jgi:ATP-dependent Clp protease ATP-binding subunit ClpA
VFDRFTERARFAMGLARQEAQRWKHDHIGTEHILLGVIKVSDGAAAGMLAQLGVDPQEVCRLVEAEVRSGVTETLSHLPLTPRSRRVLELASEQAGELDHDSIGTAHLLLGLIREGAGTAARVLREVGVEFDDLLRLALESRGVEVVQPLTPEPELWAPVDRPPSVRLLGLDDEALSEEDRSAVHATVRDLDLMREPGFADVVIAFAPETSPERMFEVGVAVGAARTVLVLLPAGVEVSSLLRDRVEAVALGPGLEQRIAAALEPSGADAPD